MMARRHPPQPLKALRQQPQHRHGDHARRNGRQYGTKLRLIEHPTGQVIRRQPECQSHAPGHHQGYAGTPKKELTHGLSVSLGTSRCGMTQNHVVKAATGHRRQEGHHGKPQKEITTLLNPQGPGQHQVHKKRGNRPESLDEQRDQRLQYNPIQPDFHTFLLNNPGRSGHPVGRIFRHSGTSARRQLPGGTPASRWSLPPSSTE